MPLVAVKTEHVDAAVPPPTVATTATATIGVPPERTVHDINENVYVGVYQTLTPAQYTKSYSKTGVPIIIDIGAYECRAGFATDELPRCKCDDTSFIHSLLRIVD
jgi:hypothetical protein